MIKYEWIWYDWHSWQVDTMHYIDFLFMWILMFVYQTLVYPNSKWRLFDRLGSLASKFAKLYFHFIGRSAEGAFFNRLWLIEMRSWYLRAGNTFKFQSQNNNIWLDILLIQTMKTVGSFILILKELWREDKRWCLGAHHLGAQYAYLFFKSCNFVSIFWMSIDETL